MKVKFNPNERNNVHWALCHTLFDEDSNEEKAKKVIDIAHKNKEGDYFIYDIELKINGEEFNFESLINNLLKNENEIIGRAVKRELENQFYDIQNKVNDILENLDYIKIDIDKRGE